MTLQYCKTPSLSITRSRLCQNYITHQSHDLVTHTCLMLFPIISPFKLWFLCPRVIICTTLSLTAWMLLPTVICSNFFTVFGYFCTTALHCIKGTALASTVTIPDKHKSRRIVTCTSQVIDMKHTVYKQRKYD